MYLVEHKLILMGQGFGGFLDLHEKVFLLAKCTSYLTPIGRVISVIVGMGIDRPNPSLWTLPSGLKANFRVHVVDIFHLKGYALRNPLDSMNHPNFFFCYLSHEYN